MSKRREGTSAVTGDEFMMKPMREAPAKCVEITLRMAELPRPAAQEVLASTMLTIVKHL